MSDSNTAPPGVDPDESTIDDTGVIRIDYKRVGLFATGIALAMVLVFVLPGLLFGGDDDESEPLEKIPSSTAAGAMPGSEEAEVPETESGSDFGNASSGDSQESSEENASEGSSRSGLGLIQATQDDNAESAIFGSDSPSETFAFLPQSDRYLDRESKLLDALHASPAVELDTSIFEVQESISDEAKTESEVAASLEEEATFTLQTGTILPAVLVAGVTTDQPGLAMAQLSHDVYDSATGRTLILPRGTRLTGQYDRDVAIAQRRVTISWSEVVTPNGQVTSLTNAIGADQTGHAGLEDQVKLHVRRAVATTTVTSAITAALAYLVRNDDPQVLVTPSGATTLPSTQQQAVSEIGEQYADLATKIADRTMGTSPSLSIRPGMEFTILITQPIQLPAYPTSP